LLDSVARRILQTSTRETRISKEERSPADREIEEGSGPEIDAMSDGKDRAEKSDMAFGRAIRFSGEFTLGISVKAGHPVHSRWKP
jgi:hypothetical protein